MNQKMHLRKKTKMVLLSAWYLETWKGGFTGLAHATGTSPPFKDGRARLTQSNLIQMPNVLS